MVRSQKTLLLLITIAALANGLPSKSHRLADEIVPEEVNRFALFLQEQLPEFVQTESAASGILACLAEEEPQVASMALSQIDCNKWQVSKATKALAKATMRKKDASADFLVEHACFQSATAVTGTAAKAYAAARAPVDAAKANGTLKGWKKKQLYKALSAAKDAFKSSKNTADKCNRKLEETCKAIKKADTALKKLATDQTCR